MFPKGRVARFDDMTTLDHGAMKGNFPFRAKLSDLFDFDVPAIY